MPLTPRSLMSIEAGCSMNLSILTARRGQREGKPFLQEAGAALLIALLLLWVAVPLASAENDENKGGKGKTLGWILRCEHTQTQEQDNIVFPGQRPAGHAHQFYNNAPAASDTTREDFLALGSNCNFVGSKDGDMSGYWTPAYYTSDHQEVEVDRMDAYYRVAPGVPRKQVKSFPEGLEVVAGSMNAPGPQYAGVRRIVAYRCGGSGNGQQADSDLPYDCTNPKYGHVVAVIVFPDCSNGQPTSADHKSHMAYSVDGECPPTHPRHVPMLRQHVVYDTIEGDGAFLSNRHDTDMTAYGMHADFFEAWNKDKLNRLIVECIRDGSGCGRMARR